MAHRHERVAFPNATSTAFEGVFFQAEASMSIDWNSVFVPTMGIAEIVLRGSIMYLGLFAVLRFMGRR